MDTIALSHGLAKAVLDADASSQRLFDSGVLRELGEQIVHRCEQANWPVVVAASRAAESLVTAAVMMSGGRLQMGQPARSTDERVMLVDTAVVTGGALHWAAASYRTAGSSWIGALVLERVRPDLDALDSDAAFDQVSEICPIGAG
jgi:adenine/guanine phosphoribosyltransferase-like PRPP-binding protein